MRATRNANKNTASVKKAEAQKREEQKNDPQAKAVGSDGEPKGDDHLKKPTGPVKKRVSTINQDTEGEIHMDKENPVERTVVVQKVVSETVVVTDVVKVEQNQSKGEVPAPMEVEEKEEEEEEVEEVEEVEVDEEGDQVDDVENEDDQNAEAGVEDYNEEEEVEEVEEVEELEEVVEEEVEEEVEEIVEEEEDEGEQELMEKRPVTERQKRKKFEVFVGGIDREASEEDLRRAFGVVGEVVEVRLMKHHQSGQSKGYAFVRFATIDQAKRAATELERTKIRGRECGVVPSEDNDTLFVGNISKSWKKEQVLEKLKEFGIEGVEEITLMSDSRNPELNRGYAFVELATHSDAVRAFIRLSKPDAIFGFDRSAKVSWAEPLLDEEALGKVKSVFVDGVPPFWSESKVREHFGKFGEIERVALARNNPKTKRNDYAFVNYVERESAVACVEALKDGELIDGDNKVKVNVALSRPAPRKKSVKGARGGYPVGGHSYGHTKGWVPSASSYGLRRGRVTRGFIRGGRAGWAGGSRQAPYEDFKPVRPKSSAYDRPYPEERSRIRPPPRGGASFTRPSRGVSRGSHLWHEREEANYTHRPSHEFAPRGRGGFLRRGRGGAYARDNDVPQGARSSRFSPLPRGRGYVSRHAPREDTYSRKPSRSHTYDRELGSDYGSGASLAEYAEGGPGYKRSYAEMDDTALYYEAEHRGYPRARVDYVEPLPASGSHYAEPSRVPLRRSPIGGGSLQAPLPVYDQPGSSTLYGAGGHVHSSVMPRGNEYASGAAELRGGSYNSSLYGDRTGSAYGLPGSGQGSYY